MTITVSKIRLAQLLLKEREIELENMLSSPCDSGEYKVAVHRMRETYGAGWRVITDADLQKEAIGKAKNAESDGYYIVDMRSGVGDDALLWRQNGKGYTACLDEAGVYPKGKKRDTDLYVPVALARSLAVTRLPRHGLRTSIAEFEAKGAEVEDA